MVLILLALLAIILFGVAFTIQWLFVVAVTVALLLVISGFIGAASDHRRGAWW
jgi:hypothetical protein